MLHFLCVLQQIKTGPNGLRITFSHLACPLCKARISCKSHAAIQAAMDDWLRLEKRVAAMASERLVYEGRQKEAELAKMDMAAYAMHIYSYYTCRRCSSPFFAGLAVCGEAPENGQEGRLCTDCFEATMPKKNCSRHRAEFVQWKCRFCCNVAAFKCWNTHSFCNSCHAKQVAGDHLSRKPPSAFPVCPGREKCPLGVDHPHVEEFCLGCVLCKNERAF